MRKLSDDQKRELWQEVRTDFPSDEMMQEIHYLRLLQYYETKELSAQERVRFYQTSDTQSKKKPSKQKRKPLAKSAKAVTRVK